VLTAELGILIPEFRLVLAAFLVTLEIDYSSFSNYLHHCAFIENMENLELLLKIRKELRNQQNNHLIILNESVNHLFPVLVLVVVNEHGLNLPKITSLLLVAADEFVFEELYVGFHLVGL